MSSKPMKLPDHYTLDDRAWYVIRHFGTHLTERDHALVKWHTLSAKALGAESRGWERGIYDNMLAQERDKYPELEAEIAAQGYRRLIGAVIDRIIAEHGSEMRWNLCPKCAGLCRGPNAKQCFRCGHDWHNAAAKD
jgi:hypothetical protein